MKKEIIKSIEYFQPFEGEYKGMEGYKIVTDKQEILILINNSQQCCEEWGYEACSEKGILETQDDLDDYIGAEILDIEIVDTEKDIYKNLTDRVYRFYSSNAEFVNIKTSKGKLQFAVYNAHNGYYGHKIYIKFNNEVIDSQL
nr:MAG TPA: hypothetical protein [Caudoviricetes sp.]